jgi:hypothetical protein
VQLGTASSLDPCGSPSGIEPARSRVRTEAFYRWPAQLVSSWTLEVRGAVVLANQSGSVVSSQGSTTSSSSYSSSIAEQDHKSPRGLSLRPSSTHGNPSQQTSSSPTESRHRQVLLVANPIHRGNSLSACSPS